MNDVKIPLKNSSRFALVNECDAEFLRPYKWGLHKGADSHVYAAACINGKYILMHRLLAKPEPKMCVDHANGDGLDNRRENIRVCSYAQNMHNRPIHSNNKLGIKGVYQDKKSSLYVAKIAIDGKRKILGWFRNAEDAGNAYIAAAKEIHGEFFFVR